MNALKAAAGHAGHDPDTHSLGKLLGAPAGIPFLTVRSSDFRADKWQGFLLELTGVVLPGESGAVFAAAPRQGVMGNLLAALRGGAFTTESGESWTAPAAGYYFRGTVGGEMVLVLAYRVRVRPDNLPAYAQALYCGDQDGRAAISIQDLHLVPADSPDGLKAAHQAAYKAMDLLRGLVGDGRRRKRTDHPADWDVVCVVVERWAANKRQYTRYSSDEDWCETNHVGRSTLNRYRKDYYGKYGANGRDGKHPQPPSTSPSPR